MDGVIVILVILMPLLMMIIALYVQIGVLKTVNVLFLAVQIVL